MREYLIVVGKEWWCFQEKNKMQGDYKKEFTRQHFYVFGKDYGEGVYDFGHPFEFGVDLDSEPDFSELFAPEEVAKQKEKAEVMKCGYTNESRIKHGIEERDEAEDLTISRPLNEVGANLNSELDFSQLSTFDIDVNDEMLLELQEIMSTPTPDEVQGNVVSEEGDVLEVKGTEPPQQGAAASSTGSFTSHYLVF